MILVSACLAGVNCRYNGCNCLNIDIKRMVKNGMAIAVCPETAGGLDTPRPPMELKRHQGGDNRLISKFNVDMTKNVIEGAKNCTKIALENNVRCAILKTKSPSCGFGKVYDGTFSGKLTAGNGIFTDMLIKSGITVYTEENYKSIL